MTVLLLALWRSLGTIKKLRILSEMGFITQVFKIAFNKLISTNYQIGTKSKTKLGNISSPDKLLGFSKTSTARP
jgi:hypothetical protein